MSFEHFLGIVKFTIPISLDCMKFHACLYGEVFDYVI